MIAVQRLQEPNMLLLLSVLHSLFYWFLQFPLLHQEGVQNILFSWFRILGWMFNGICSSVIIFFFSSHSILHQAFRSDGSTADYEVLGVLMYTCVVWTVNCQMALLLSYFTWIQHFFIWGSIIFWYIFLAIYGSIPPSISTSAYKVLVEACGPAPFYWLSTLFVVVSALLPYFSYAALQTSFFPPYHVIIQIMSKEESVSRASVGFSARFEARIQHMKEKTTS